jgi:serine protease Do
VNDIIENGKFEKPYIGITMQVIEDKELYGKVVDLGYDSVIFIESLTPGGSAQVGGLLSGDVILEFNGQIITGTPDVIEILWEKYPDDEVDVLVLRNGEIISKKIKLQRKKD